MSLMYTNNKIKTLKKEFGCYAREICAKPLPSPLQK